MKHLQPTEAWAYLQAHAGDPPEQAPLFIDIRMEIESLYVGRPPGVVLIPWYEYPEVEPDPAEFVSEVLEAAGSKDRPILLICRSGKRTQDAGRVLEAKGFTDVAHVLHGFEGELDDRQHRSTLNGWRHDGLPWEQM